MTVPVALSYLKNLFIFFWLRSRLCEIITTSRLRPCIEMERVIAGTDEIPFSYASADLSGPGSDRNRLATRPEPRRGKLQKNCIASLRLSRPLAQEQPVGRYSGALHETVDLAEFFTNRTILESTYEIDVPASGSEEWPLQNKNNDKAGQEPSSRAIALSNKHSRLESHSVHNYDPTSPSRSTSVTSAQYRNSFNEWSIQYNSSVASPQLPDDTIKKSLMVFEAHPAQDDHATYTTQSAGMPRQAQSDPLSEGIPLRQPHSLGSVNGVTKTYNVGKNPPIMSGNADVSGPSIGKSNGAHINIYQNAPQYTEASALHQATFSRERTPQNMIGACATSSCNAHQRMSDLKN